MGPDGQQLDPDTIAPRVIPVGDDEEPELREENPAGTETDGPPTLPPVAPNRCTQYWGIGGVRTEA